MILTMLTAGLVLVSPTDTPIEPIPAALIQAGIDAGVLDETCQAYGTLIPLFSAALDGDVELAMDVADAYVIWSIEDGWEPEGARLTLEAHDVLVDYIHACV